MSFDAMKKVLDAERSARDAHAKATADARQLVLDAEGSGKALLTSTREAAEAEAARMMQDAELLGARRREEILLHAENQCAVLRAHGEQKLSLAADRIVERIVKN